MDSVSGFLSPRGVLFGSVIFYEVGSVVLLLGILLKGVCSLILSRWLRIVLPRLVLMGDFLWSPRLQLLCGFEE